MENNYSFTLEPYGGVDEIGSNMTVIETENFCIIIDMGILFPMEDNFDINYLIPDLSKLPTGKKTIGIFTHGHEDHIGAISHLVLHVPDIELYATPFTKELMKNKLSYKKLFPKINEISEDLVLTFDDLKFSFLHVNHSIPQTIGVLIKTICNSVGLIFISDFKVDNKTPYEKAFNFKKLLEWKKDINKTFALLDSTNILNTGRTASEGDLIPDIEEIIATHKFRVFFTLFSSNIHRLNTIFSAAKKHQRNIIVVGNSIRGYAKAALDSGLLDLNLKILDYRDVKDLNNPNNLFIVSGCQGDFKSALRRISYNDDPKIKLTPTDLFVFSSKAIPGNEKKINKIYNEISRRGTKIITSNDKTIHASGHPGQEDLKEFIDTINPDYYIPIHGETYFLDKHLTFIKKNYPQITPILIHNFHSILFHNNSYKVMENQKLDPILIHGHGIEIEREKISERRKISTQGCAFLSLNRKTGAIEFTTQGLPFEADNLQDDLIKLITNIYHSKLKKFDDEEIIEEIRVAIRRFYKPHLGYRPVAIVHLC